MKWFRLPSEMTNVSVGGLLHEAYEGIIRVEDHLEETVRTLIPTATQVGKPEWEEDEKQPEPETPIENSETSASLGTVASSGTVGSLGGTIGSFGTTSSPGTVGTTGTAASEGTLGSASEIQPSNSTPSGTTRTGSDESSGKKDDTVTEKTLGET